MDISLNYFIAGALGVILQLCIKIPILKSQSEKANHPFSFKEYLANDWYTILGSFVSVGILIVCIDELLAVKPELEKYIKWLFVFVGFTGSSIIQSIFSITSKKIMAIIDIKTNIADGIQPPVDSGNVEGVKEIAKDKAELNEIKTN